MKEIGKIPKKRRLKWKKQEKQPKNNPKNRVLS